jgi:hypothetical protein
VALVGGEAAARELWRSGDASLEASGSLRELFTVTRGTDASDFAEAALGDPTCLPATTFPSCAAWAERGETDVITSLTRLRLRLDGRLSERISAVFVYDHEWLGGTLDTFEAQVGDSLSSGRFDDLGWTITESRDFEWRHEIYRGFVKYEGEHLEVTLGRQRVPWGVGRLWNPIDRFNAIGPLALEPDQSVGVDAAKVRWAFSGFSYAEAVYAVGEHARDRSYAGRLHGVVRDVDVSIMGGVFEEAPTAGFDLASNLWDAAGRLEVVWTDPDREVRPFGETRSGTLPSYWQVVVSVDYDFDIGDGVYALVEHLYNGNALGFGSGRAGPALGFFQESGTPAVVVPGSPDLLGQSRVVSAAEHLTGFQLGYDLTPELRGNLLVIADWRGGSAGIFPSLLYSPLGWLELTVGVQLFDGPRESEFGTAETVGYLLAEAFF